MAARVCGGTGAWLHGGTAVRLHGGTFVRRLNSTAARQYGGKALRRHGVAAAWGPVGTSARRGMARHGGTSNDGTMERWHGDVAARWQGSAAAWWHRGMAERRRGRKANGYTGLRRHCDTARHSRTVAWRRGDTAARRYYGTLSREQRAAFLTQLANLSPYPESVPINHLVPVLQKLDAQFQIQVVALQQAADVKKPGLSRPG